MEILKRFFRRRIRAIKWWIGLTLGVGSLLSWWLISIDRGPIEVPITLSHQRFPVVEVGIGDTRLPCALALCSKYPLNIAEEHLADVPKSQRGEGSWMDAQGQEFTAPLFAVASVKLGTLKIGKMLVSPHSEFSGDVSGSITWPFHKVNVLLDLPRKTVWGVQHVKDLPSLGFDPRAMEQVDCTINPKGVFFTSRTADGELLKTCLATCCNFNVINSSLLNPDNDEESVRQRLQIGTRNFGITRFHPYDLTPQLGIDVILGIEFLRKHVIYIDATQGRLYFGQAYATALSHPSVVKLPVEYTLNGRPIVEVELEGQTKRVLFDLGSDQELDLVPSVACTSTLRRLHHITTVNYRGIESKADRYLLPKCSIGGVELNNIIATLRPPVDSSTNIKLAKNLGTVSSFHGILGRPLLHRTNVHLDLPNSSIWLVDRQADLTQIGIELESYQRVPFEMVPFGIVCSVDTDLGRLKLMVDTGFTGSVLRPNFIPEDNLIKDDVGNSCMVSDTFVLGDCDYGQQWLYPLEISPRLEGFDGVLGMDFFSQHAFFIDYPNRVIYFQKPDPSKIATANCKAS